MDEIEELPSPTTERQAVRDSAGDRIVAGLAALLLIGGLIVAAVNQLTPPNPTALASMSPTATDTPRESGAPRPAARILHEVTVEPVTMPSRPPVPIESRPLAAETWLEAVGEVPILRSPGESGKELTRLAPGMVTIAKPDDGHQGWLLAWNGIGYAGYVDARGEAERAGYNLYPVDPDAPGGWIDYVTAGPDGLLAVVSPDGGEAAMYASVEGERWSPVSERSGAQPPLAWGPSGWISVAPSPRIWNSGIVRTSSDGSTWEAAGALRWIAAEELVGSSLGYVLVNQWSDVRYAPTVWYSRDGLTWQESVDPFGRSGADGKGQAIHLLATPFAFVAWTGDENRPSTALVATSADGLRWNRVSANEALSSDLQLVAAGNHLLGIATDSLGGVAAYSADLTPTGRAAIARQVGLGAKHGVEIASNGVDAYALGTVEGSSAVVVWHSTGGGWARVGAAPNELGPAPHIGAVGQNGLVVIGSRTTLAGENPIFWHLRPGGSWVAEPDPLVAVVEDEAGDPCGPLPSNALLFVILRTSLAPGCFGDTPITFTAWATWGRDSCRPCMEDGVTGAPWLQGNPTLLLSPVAGDSGHGAAAYLPPATRVDFDLPTGRWVQLTGHFDDPLSVTCSGDPGDLSGDEAAIMECRRHFVVTSIAEVAGNS